MMVTSQHYPATRQDDEDKDWCDTCTSVTLYHGEKCACCGRVWGYMGGTCEAPDGPEGDDAR